MQQRPLILLWFFALTLAVVRLFYINVGIVGLAPDEAQYWHWLSDLQWSYVTKPPLTTWLIGFGTWLFGDTYLGVRCFAVVGHMLASVLAFLIAKEVHSVRAGWWAFAAFQVTPLLAIGGILMVSDVPALVCWLAALWLLTRLSWRQPEWGTWVLVGIFVGLAGLSKYTAAFFYPLLFIYLVWQQRRYVFKPQPYVAGLISLGLQAPVLLWNAHHDWVGIKHVLGQAGAGVSSSYDVWPELGEFFIGQAATLGVLSFLAMVIFWLRPWGCSGKQKILWAFAAPLFAFFVWKATGAKVQANWPILATSVSLIAVCTCLGVHQKMLVRAVFAAGLMVNAALAFLLHDTFILRDMGVNLPMKADPSKDLRGWAALAQRVGQAADNMPAGEQPYVITTRYRMMAELTFELQRQGFDYEVIYVNSGSHRLSQYDLWPWPTTENLRDRTALVVRGSDGLPHIIRDGFTDCSNADVTLITQENLLIRTGYLTTCRGYRGMSKIMPTTH